MSFFDNTRKPSGLGGRIMVPLMNLGHRSLAAWGLHFLRISPHAAALDCGCGGGAVLKRLLKKCPQGQVRGIDYSPVSVERSRRVNEAAIAQGRCAVLQGSVADMLFAAAQFDLVTAFETVYFWPDLPQSLREIRRVLKPGGVLLICNECSDPQDDRWTGIVDGMTIYSDRQLQALLEQAGFCRVRTHTHKKGWLCITAQAPADDAVRPLCQAD